MNSGSTGIIEYEGSCSESEPCGNEDMPGFLEMGKGLFGDARDFMGNFLKGKDVLVPDEIAQMRLDFCQICEYKHITKKGKLRCTKCGCYMDYKVHVASSICPIQKWDKYEK